MDATKPARTTFSIWPATLLKVNILKAEIAQQRGESIDIDTLLIELVDYYRSAKASKPVAIRRQPVPTP